MASECWASSNDVMQWMFQINPFLRFLGSRQIRQIFLHGYNEVVYPLSGHRCILPNASILSSSSLSIGSKLRGTSWASSCTDFTYPADVSLNSNSPSNRLTCIAIKSVREDTLKSIREDTVDILDCTLIWTFQWYIKHFTTFCLTGLSDTVKSVVFSCAGYPMWAAASTWDSGIQLNYLCSASTC